MRLREMIAVIQQEQAEERERVRQERERLRQERQELREQRKELRDYAAIWIAVLAALFTGWQAYEAHQARKDAHEQFMTAQSTATQHAETARRDAQESLKIQTQLAERSAEQSRRSADAAEQSNHLALEALHISQAAIIDATAELQGEIADGRGTVVAKIINNGRTGAYAVHGHLHVIAAQVTEDQAYKFATSDKTAGPPHSILSTAFLSPGAGAELRSEMNIDARHVVLVKNGTVPIWIFGEVHYRDIFSIAHLLEFCFRYNAHARFMDLCSEHNLSR